MRFVLLDGVLFIVDSKQSSNGWESVGGDVRLSLALFMRFAVNVSAFSEYINYSVALALNRS